MRNYYTLKEVLLALRKEQLQFVDKLHNLDSSLDNYGDLYYDGSHFFPMSLNNGQLLGYCLKFNKDARDLSYSSFIENGKDFRIGELFVEVTKRNNGDYTIATNRVNVLKEKQDHFNEMIDSILGDRFFKEAKDMVSFEDNEGNKELLIDCDSITYATGDRIKNLKVTPRFSYYANNDLVICDFPLDSLKDKKDEFIKQVLETKLPKEYFSPYIQNIIDTSCEKQKEIILPNDEIYQRHADFKIMETENAYVLKKNHHLYK